MRGRAIPLMLVACTGTVADGDSSSSGDGSTHATSSSTMPASAAATTAADATDDAGEATSTPGESSGPGETTGGGGPGLFPLAPSADGTHLVDADGDPFFLHGEAAWSLVVQLDDAQTAQYLDDRAARGMTTLMINLIEHEFSDDPPNDAAGNAPFSDPFDWSTTDDAYFDAAHAKLAAARERGMFVLLYPAYLGYGGGSEGWFQEMSAQDPAVCSGYGTYVGERFADLDNLAWIAGGDFNPPPGSDGEACMLAIVEAISAIQPDAMWSYHGGRGTVAFDQAAFVPHLDLDGVYTDETTADDTLAELAAGHGVPLFLIEDRYEGEFGDPASQRAQAWWADLSGNCGQLMGNRPMWLFDAGWQDALDSQLSRDLVHLRTLFDAIEWWTLRPTTTLVDGGDPGSTQFVAAARDPGGTLAILYVPEGAARMLVLDPSELAGTATATLVDPTDGHTEPLAIGGDGTLVVPDANAAGDADWVVRLDA